jgi:spore maturation protein CgeB
VKVYCVQYSGHAGRWIYNGIAAAWDKLGYEIYHPDVNNPETTTMMFFPTDSKTLNDDYYMMCTADMINCDTALTAVQNANKAFLFVQPTQFPEPWGAHPNFRNILDTKWITELNKLDNVVYWTFADVREEYYHLWQKPIHTIPLAFDNLNYNPNVVSKFQQFDISFVGGWANNGFDEKRKIIIDIFSKFKDSGLKCGFFVNKNLTHQQECDLLRNSKLTLNIHDAYQRSLGLDTNERTFKSLGLNGALVSDTVGQLGRLFPEVKTSLDANEIVEITRDLLNLNPSDLEEIKSKNKDDILTNHCYTNRIQELVKL